MAIHPDFPGLTLSVRIGAHKLPEYRDSDIVDPPRVVSYMIEAVPDSIFSIHAHASPQANFNGSSIALHIYVDGKYVDGTLIDAANIRQGEGAGTTSQGRYVRHDMVRRYQFASRERQIELVEKVSTSLSSRPRASKSSSKTPNVSYSGYQSVGIDSAAPPYSRSPESEPPGSREAYRSVMKPPTPSADFHSIDLPDEFSPGISVVPALPFRAAAEARHLEAELPSQNYITTSTTANHSVFSRAPRRGLARKTMNIPPVLSRRPNILPTKLDFNVSNTAASTNERYASRSIAHPPARSPVLSTAKDTESATAGSDFTAPEELGTIKIEICHVNKKETVAFGRSSSTTAQIGSAAQEAVKDKSGGLLVRFTAPQAVSPITTWDVRAVDNDQHATVTYLYHYRTHEMLDALGVLSKEAKDERILPPSQAFAEDPSERNGFRPKGKMNQMVGLQSKDGVSGEDTVMGDATSQKEVVDEEEWEVVDGEKPDASDV